PAGRGHQAGPGRAPGRQPAALRRLARAVPLSRSPRQGHQGRRPARRRPDLSEDQPDGGDDRQPAGRFSGDPEMIRLRCAPALALLLPMAIPVAAQVEHVEDLQYPPLARFEVPQPQRVELENGLVVLLLEDHELPLVEATALVRAGSALDPADKVGLAELAGQVLRTGGTETLTGDQLDDWL